MAELLGVLADGLLSRYLALAVGGLEVLKPCGLLCISQKQKRGQGQEAVFAQSVQGICSCAAAVLCYPVLCYAVLSYLTESAACNAQSSLYPLYSNGVYVVRYT